LHALLEVVCVCRDSVCCCPHTLCHHALYSYTTHPPYTIGDYALESEAHACMEAVDANRDGKVAYCARVLCSCTVLMYCAHVLCPCTVLMYCAHVLCSCTVLMCCAHVLCSCTVLMYYMYCARVWLICARLCLICSHTPFIVFLSFARLTSKTTLSSQPG
jgi:hypothetical protein